MKSDKEIERELAYSWTGSPKIIRSLAALRGWKRSLENYRILDSIYDTEDGTLARQSVGVRIRSKNDVTTLTAKKYIDTGESGESIFEENSKTLATSIHPDALNSKEIGLGLANMKLTKQLQFINNRQEVLFNKNGQSVLLVNEDVTYANRSRIYSEHILEVEFINSSKEFIDDVRNEIEAKFQVKLFKEGKTDRAKRFLREQQGPLIENIRDEKPLKMSAHGGKGLMEMRFFHQPYNHFSSDLVNRKVIGFKNSNWDFFGYAKLPVGAEIKNHQHNETDEIYFIIKGSATMSMDGVEHIVSQGDCILTRKGSCHSVKDVTKPLEFVAIEIR